MTKPTQDKETLREAVARAYWSVALKNGLANDLRQWDERQWKDGEFDCFSPAVDSKTKALVLEAMDAAIATMFERLRTPSEAACVGLARDIMMWLDMEPKTPRALFKHLERIGREIPQWLRDEPEMRSLDHVPSKATRCAIIWQAMVPAFQQENSDATERSIATRLHPDNPHGGGAWE